MEAVYPAGASALARGRRRRPAAVDRARRRTAPVTFAEIKEVDEENEEGYVEASGARRRRPDVLDEKLGLQFAEFRRRRARGDALRERDPDSPSSPCSSPSPQYQHQPPARAGSEPSALHRSDSTDTSNT